MASVVEQTVETIPRILVTPPGPRSKEMLSKQSNYETRAVSHIRAFPIAIESAKGASIKDVDGNIYIDWISGISVLNLGHVNPDILLAVQSQLARIWHALEFPTEARISFLEKINSVFPEGLKGHAKILFSITGGDACETAISLARRVTKRNTVIAFEGGYHGIHQGVVGVTSGRNYLAYSGVLRSGVFHVPYPYPYRFPFPREREGDEGKTVLRYIEHLISDPHSGMDDPAAILVEPIQGEGGYIVPPDDFLPGLREIADKFQIPLIVDEVQSGFGRTGRFWGCELTGTAPDIMCVSKSVGAGIPLALVAYKEEYDTDLPEAFHLGTYRANPLALAAGAASIDFIAKNNLLSRVERVGKKLLSEFEVIGERSTNIGDVRGVGFMIGNEIVESKETRTPSKANAQAIRKWMFEHGLLMHTCGHYK
jgi:4-aminobutyrate aminotransferase-like enzyme